MKGIKLRRWLADDALAWVLAGVAFAGSYGHLVALAAAHGVHGWMAFTTAGCVDVTVAMAARERQRDKRIARERRGLVSWPVLVLAGAVVLTLASNLARAQHSVWGWVEAGIPALALLGAISFLERRAAHDARQSTSGKGGTGTGRTARKTAPAVPVNTSVAGTAGAPSVPAPVPVRAAVAGIAETVPVPEAVKPSGTADRFRSMDALVAEARGINADWNAKHGKDISANDLVPLLKVSKGRACQVLRQIKDNSGVDVQEAAR